MRGVAGADGRFRARRVAGKGRAAPGAFDPQTAGSALRSNRHLIHYTRDKRSETYLVVVQLVPPLRPGLLRRFVPVCSSNVPLFSIRFRFARLNILFFASAPSPESVSHGAKTRRKWRRLGAIFGAGLRGKKVGLGRRVLGFVAHSVVYYASTAGVKEWRNHGRKEITTAKRCDLNSRA